MRELRYLFLLGVVAFVGALITEWWALLFVSIILALPLLSVGAICVGDNIRRRIQ
ncbi:hypothetical protein MN032_10845 [Agromyces atrinae]|uniref:hypothetical protein n=1 Tax=Agromyces atrinae TaxID=592376 RepID=UPI001F5A5B3B|nr:hypothetical protein [Agromyces atrinae]MCI2958194.1 hypothetical protein [Agromyces atrinae]